MLFVPGVCTTRTEARMPKKIHIYVYIYMHTYTCLHTYINAYIHTYRQTDRQTHRQTHIQTYESQSLGITGCAGVELPRLQAAATELGGC